MAPTRVVIDTDPGVDDAVAILLALVSPELDVLALTTVTGNVNLDHTTENARRLLELANRPDVLVAAGCAVPLNGEPKHASEVHGNDGLGDLEWPTPSIPVSETHAVDLLAELINEGPLTIIAIGPLTNLAMLVQQYPGIDEKLEHLVIMGGASWQGNVNAAAEFNIWADPEAAKIVFGAKWKITFMPLDLTHQAYLNDDDLAYFRSLNTEVGARVANFLEPYALFHVEWYGNRDIIMHDAMAVYQVIDPTAITCQGVTVQVETGGEYSRGATWVDRGHQHADSSTRVGVSVDNDTFRMFLRERLAQLH
jgi:purine nucleosidase